MNLNHFDIKERIEILKKLVNKKNQFETKQLNQWKEQNGIQTDLNFLGEHLFEKSNIKAIENSNLKSIKDSNIKSIKDKYSDFKFQDLRLESKLETKINPEEIDLPIFDEATGNPFKGFKMNDKRFALAQYKKDNKLYIGDISKGENFIEKISFNEDFKQLLEGSTEIKNISIDEKKKYVDFIHNNVGLKHNLGKYFNKILNEVKNYKREGEGYRIYKPKYFVDQFITLRKYLTAKKAGHNNLDSLIIKILNKLKKSKHINEKNYEKIKLKFNI